MIYNFDNEYMNRITKDVQTYRETLSEESDAVQFSLEMMFDAFLDWVHTQLSEQATKPSSPKETFL